jgi:hypothetical protein
LSSTVEDQDGLIRVESKYFVGGCIVNRSGRVEAAAPIMKYMEGWTISHVYEYCKKKGWGFEYTYNRHGANNKV